MNKVLFLLRGLPGAGKTLLAETILSSLNERTSGVMLAADDFFTDPKTGKYNYNPELTGKAHFTCRWNCEKEMNYNTPFIIVHNTFTTEKEISPYVTLAEQYGYTVFSLVVENRHGNTDIHNVPEEVIHKMSQRFTVKLK